MNKRKIIIFIVATIILLLVEIAASTRTISISNDSYYKMIRNSNGKCWEATTDNIQIAINDLDNSSGTVWLPGNKVFIFTKTLIIYKFITLDMGGSSFKISDWGNITMVEMKDGSAIINGNIDVANHHDTHDARTNFWEPHAAIYLNASSYIESPTLIQNMHLDSIGKGYNLPGFYDDTYTGRGYGIYLHASNVNVPQLITNVRVENLYTRNFYSAIYIHNERHPTTGQYGARIEGNSFERLIDCGDSYYIKIKRDTTVSQEKCSTSRNVFNLIQFQAGRPAYWGGDQISWNLLVTDGSGNIWKNVMGWDPSFLRGNGTEIILTSDSYHCFVSGRCGITGRCINSGLDNTLLDTTMSILNGNSLIIKG
jgi:hypothetical protein